MRFNVIKLAWALAAPALAADVGWQVGQSAGALQEWDTEPSVSSAASVVPNTKSQLGNGFQQPTPSVVAASAHPTTTAIIPGLSTPAAIIPSLSTPAAVVPPILTTAAKPSATPTPTPATPAGTGPGTGGVIPKGGQVLYIVNKYGADVAIVTGNSGGPAPSGAPPSLANGATATVTIQSGWAGRFAINPTGVPAGSQLGTKIEGEISDQGYWDISLVDGYTVPITCTCGSSTTPFIGCNIDLLKQSAKCPSPSGDALCLNPARPNDYGPSDAWFAACKDASYVFPKNDIATQACPAGSSLTCCVGSSCAAGKNQGKRWINPVYARWAFPRSAFDMKEK